HLHGTMLSLVGVGVLCGISIVAIIIAVILLCRLYRKRSHRTCIPPFGGYDAIGDCKPPSLISVTSTSQ
ncbi:hypothetical protein ACJMK2_028345, partial [Sinanodonta woodiana]